MLYEVTFNPGFKYDKKDNKYTKVCSSWDEVQAYLSSYVVDSFQELTITGKKVR